MKILEDTRTILTILVTLVGSIFWLATLSSQVLENKADIAESQKLDKEYLVTLQQIQLDLAIVRTKLEKLER
jgi:hypothetical protein